MVVDCVSVKVEPTLAFGKYRYLCAVGYRPTCLLYTLVQHWCHVRIRYQCCNYGGGLVKPDYRDICFGLLMIG